ncbi:MAG TPA: ABC transporter substrate-binding protein, partial [Anaerolineae bacterium]|nr:ABC transporter substrate-binding protein [Anaerolineae bacterium]
KPDHLVSNGAFRLTEFDEMHGLLVRNPDYFGDYTGNLDQFRWKMVPDPAAVMHGYLSSQFDYVTGLTPIDVPVEVPANEFVDIQNLSILGLNLIPDQPPLDDVRVRRAIALGLDRERLDEIMFDVRLPPIHGGIVPPGMAGHSPELGLAFNLDQARQLLTDAGYPGGQGLPILKYYYPGGRMAIAGREELKRQLAEHLGIQIELNLLPTNVPWWTAKDSQLQGGGWTADYPDPDNFLRQSSFYRVLRNRGWHHPRLEQLLEEAARTTDRAQRLAMYREADRILVNEEAVVIPLAYSSLGNVALLKPWVKGMKYNALGSYSLKDIVIEPH